MSETEKLRSMLDARGIAWKHTNREKDLYTRWRSPLGHVSFHEDLRDTVIDGHQIAPSTYTDLYGVNLTARQIVEATFGREKCEMTVVEDKDRILYGWLECSECGPVYPPAATAIQGAVRYCPFCGRSVTRS